MKCPFCASKVDDAATVCPACRRDFTVSKPLMIEKQALDLKVEGLEAENRQLKALLAVRERSFRIFEQPRSALSAIGGYILFPIAVAVVLHFALVVMLKAYVALRLGTIVLCVLCGYALQAQRRPSWFVTASFAVLVAVGSVVAMSATIHFQNDQHPDIIPTLAADQRDAAEYMASMALAYVFGAIVALYMRPLQLPAGVRYGETFDETMARLMSHNLPFWAELPAEQRLTRYRGAIRACLSVLTFVGMLWAGFSKFLSHPPQ